MSGDAVVDETPKAGRLSERDKLEQEKIKLAKEIGIWQTFEPVDNYAESDQFKKIIEIDKRLSEIVNG